MITPSGIGRNEGVKEYQIDMSGKNLTVFPKIEPNYLIKKMNFSNNEISSLKTLPTIPSLHELNLDNTKILSFEDAAPQPNLFSISLRNTPISTCTLLNIMVVAVFGDNIRYVNGLMVSETEISFGINYRINIADYLRHGWVLFSLNPLKIYDFKSKKTINLTEMQSSYNNYGNAKKSVPAPVKSRRKQHMYQPYQTLENYGKNDRKKKKKHHEPKTTALFSSDSDCSSLLVGTLVISSNSEFSSESESFASNSSSPQIQNQPKNSDFVEVYIPPPPKDSSGEIKTSFWQQPQKINTSDQSKNVYLQNPQKINTSDQSKNVYLQVPQKINTSDQSKNVYLQVPQKINTTDQSKNPYIPPPLKVTKNLDRSGMEENDREVSTQKHVGMAYINKSASAIFRPVGAENNQIVRSSSLSRVNLIGEASSAARESYVGKSEELISLPILSAETSTVNTDSSVSSIVSKKKKKHHRTKQVSKKSSTGRKKSKVPKKLPNTVDGTTSLSEKKDYNNDKKKDSHAHEKKKEGHSKRESSVERKKESHSKRESTSRKEASANDKKKVNNTKDAQSNEKRKESPSKANNEKKETRSRRKNLHHAMSMPLLDTTAKAKEDKNNNNVPKAPLLPIPTKSSKSKEDKKAEKEKKKGAKPEKKKSKKSVKRGARTLEGKQKAEEKFEPHTVVFNTLDGSDDDTANSDPPVFKKVDFFKLIGIEPDSGDEYLSQDEPSDSKTEEEDFGEVDEETIKELRAQGRQMFYKERAVETSTIAELKKFVNSYVKESLENMYYEYYSD